MPTAFPMAFQDIVRLSADIAARIRAERPRIHCLTNTVAEPITANTLLALGAVPSMTSFSPELPDFLSGARGLMVNVGTPSEEKAEARRLAVEIARDGDIPWVLDPVMVHWSSTRRREAEHLLSLPPAAIRGNAQEIDALAGALTGFAGVKAITGEVDRIIQAERTASVEGGTPLMAQVTATGCALSAVVAACCAVHADAFEASLAACAIFAGAGAEAATKAEGPGTLSVHLLDALAQVNAQDLATHLDGIVLEQEDAA